MNYNKFRVLLLAVVLAILSVGELYARQNSALPELAPREVEITGNLTIVFPTLRRQPIMGFNPPPRVPDIPESRLPFAESYKQPRADLPSNPLMAPDPPTVSSLSSRTPVTGILEATTGRYLDRRILANIALKASHRTTLLFDAEYHGSNGHEPFSGSSIDSGFDMLNASLDLERVSGPLLVKMGANGFNKSYSLFGAKPSRGSISSVNPERTFGGFEGYLGIHSKPGSRIKSGITLSGGSSSINTDVFDPAARVDPTTERTESFLSANLSLSAPLGKASVQVSGIGTTSGLDVSTFPGSTLRSGFSKLTLSFPYRSRGTLTLGAAVFGFSSQRQSNAGSSRSLIYISPLFKAVYSLSPSLRLYAGNEPGIESGLLKDVYRNAPFLMDEPLLHPSISSVDAHSGLSFLSEYLTAGLRLGWKDQPYRRYVHRDVVPTLGYDQGYGTLGYSDANVVYANLDIEAILAPGLHAGIDMEVRNGTLNSPDVDIPYFSPFVLGGFLSISLLDGDALVQATLKHESSRPVDIRGTVKSPGFTTLDVLGSYFLNDSYGVTLGIRNLGSAPEFWDNYPIEPSTFYFGARYRW